MPKVLVIPPESHISDPINTYIMCCTKVSKFGLETYMLLVIGWLSIWYKSYKKCNCMLFFMQLTTHNQIISMAHQIRKHVYEVIQHFLAGNSNCLNVFINTSLFAYKWKKDSHNKIDKILLLQLLYKHVVFILHCHTFNLIYERVLWKIFDRKKRIYY